ncbi:MAG: hypothetical protein L6Q33_15020 [Bacteriovoracaceae bacterium]|nr:hypothetical protein [Bacteriovoracaceae bacterium]
MNQTKDPNKKHYFQPIDFDYFESMIDSLLKKKEIPQITVWMKGDEESKAEAYVPWEYVSAEKRIKLKPTGSLITKITGSNMADKDVCVKIPIDQHTHLFTISKLIFHSVDLTYSLIIGEIIYMSKKRGSFRLNASKIIPVQFKIDNQVFDSLDLSTGGTSFLVPEADKERFPKNRVFGDCTLRFDRKNYHINKAKIAGHFPPTTPDGEKPGFVKIGIAFLDLNYKTEDELYIKISAEARGEEMKKKFDTLLNKKSEEEDKAG